MGKMNSLSLELEELRKCASKLNEVVATIGEIVITINDIVGSIESAFSSSPEVSNFRRSKSSSSRKV